MILSKRNRVSIKWKGNPKGLPFFFAKKQVNPCKYAKISIFAESNIN